MDIRKEQLKHIIQNTMVNHKHLILQEPTHIYCRINQLNGQKTGNLLEHYIIDKYFMVKNHESLCIGDVHYNNINYEIKSSLGYNNRFHYVQIRLNHDCHYLLTAYYLSENNVETLGELFMFNLNKEQMKHIIYKYGSYAHGTIKKLGQITMDDLNDVDNNKEYSLRPRYNSKCWNELLLYRIDTII